MTNRETIFTNYIKAQKELNKWIEANAEFINMEYCEGTVLSFLDNETGETVDIMSDHHNPIRNSIHVGFFCDCCGEYEEVSSYDCD